uniref:Myotubularin phosphatase domain-containing protein n=1 Tax=Macrostomum lignano TaxID=282301 RepID=A0A1I8JPH8_9PLAT
GAVSISRQRSAPNDAAAPDRRLFSRRLDGHASGSSPRPATTSRGGGAASAGPQQQPPAMAASELSRPPLPRIGGLRCRRRRFAELGRRRLRWLHSAAASATVDGPWLRPAAFPLHPLPVLYHAAAPALRVDVVDTAAYSSAQLQLWSALSTSLERVRLRPPYRQVTATSYHVSPPVAGLKRGSSTMSPRSVLKTSRARSQQSSSASSGGALLWQRRVQDGTRPGGGPQQSSCGFTHNGHQWPAPGRTASGARLQPRLSAHSAQLICRCPVGHHVQESGTPGRCAR